MFCLLLPAFPSPLHWLAKAFPAAAWARAAGNVKFVASARAARQRLPRAMEPANLEALKQALPPMPMTKEEKANVGLATGANGEADERFFLCIACEKNILKHPDGILRHFSRPPHTDIAPGVVRGWVVYKDAHTIKRMKKSPEKLAKHLHLTKVGLLDGLATCKERAVLF